MMTIRDEQMNMLQRALHDQRYRAMVRELLRLRSGAPERCREAVRRTHALLNASEPWSLTERMLVARWMYDEPAFPDLDGKWGRLVRRVLTNPRVEPSQRVRFFEEELAPRLRAQEPGDERNEPHG